MSIPDAAVEAAAEALARRNWGDTLNAADYIREARPAIEAAMPAIREALAQEIEAIEVEWTKDANGYPVHYEMLDPREMRLVAARIVRGGTP